MNKKGFTLVEMLAVIIILAILALLASPAYTYIRDSINQTMYENKVKLLLAAAESWAGETGFDSVNIGHLIEEGKIEADNELGDFKNPATGDSMLCNVIRIDYINNQYVAKYTEEQVCDFNELVIQSSIITFKKYKENGKELKDQEWTNGNIVLKVELKEGHTGKAGSITHLEIRGNNQNVSVDLNNDFSSKNAITVQASQILKTEFEAKVTVLENGITKEYRTKTEVRIDKQRPLVYTDELSIKNENSWTSGGKKVTFTMSDGNGSGIFGYAITTNPDCTKATYTQTDKKKITKEIGAGTHYICVKDKAGNLSEDVSKQKFEVSKVDNNPPKIDKDTGFQIVSNGNGYNNNKVILNITATDETNMSMCISNTGFEKDCVWEPYSPTKNWNISNSLDGKTHYVYLTLRDQAGNKVNLQSKGYQVYLECSKTTKTYTGNWGACSVSCGGGVQYRTYQIKDNHTAKVCSSGSDQQSCNTHQCSVAGESLWLESGLADDYEYSSEIYLGEPANYNVHVFGYVSGFIYEKDECGDNCYDPYRYKSTTLYLQYSKNAETEGSWKSIRVATGAAKWDDTEFDKTISISNAGYIRFKFGCQLTDMQQNNRFDSKADITYEVFPR